MRAIRTSLAIAVLGAVIALQGCSSTPVEQLDRDRATCNLARSQRLAGNPAWSATLDQIKDLQTAWYCQQYLMAWDAGDNPGGGM